MTLHLLYSDKPSHPCGFLQHFPTFGVPSSLRLSFSHSAAMMRMLFPTMLKGCVYQVKKAPFLTILKFCSPVDVHSIFFFPLMEGQKPFEKWAVQFYLCHISAQSFSDFFDLFLLWMWHLIIFNLIRSIWDYPLGHCIYRSSHVSYWSLLIWPYFFLLYIHYLLTSVLIGELFGHTH